MFNDKPHYYTQNPTRDDRTRLARGIDFLLSLLLVWMTSVLAVQVLPLGQAASITLTFVFIALGVGLVIRYHTRKNSAVRLHRDIWYSARKCRKTLQELDSPREFASLVKEILAGALPFTGLKLLAPAGDSTIDLTGYVKKRKVGVMCLNPGTEDHKTSADEIKKFIREIIQAGFDSGMVVTTGTYSDEARRFVRRMRGRARVHLIDGYSLPRMARRAGHPVFPDEKWQDEKDNRLSGLEMALSIKENIMASRRKSVYFILLGLVFVVISALQGGIIGSAYLVFGIINLFIGFSGLILTYLRKYELLLDWL